MFETQYSWDDNYDLCVEISLANIIKHFILYGLLRLVTYRYEKSHILSNHIVSMLVCWKFMLSYNFSDVIAYYWYDLMLSVWHRDSFMILHHLVSLYSLQQCSWHPDFESIRLAAVYLKSGDIVLHHYKIIDALEIYNNYRLKLRIYQAISVLITILLWLYYRVYRCIEVYPFETTTFYVIAIIFHLLNVLWIVKLCVLLKKITLKIFTSSR